MTDEYCRDEIFIESHRITLMCDRLKVDHPEPVFTDREGGVVHSTSLIGEPPDARNKGGFTEVSITWIAVATWRDE